MRQAWRRKITVADLPPPSSNALAMPGLNGDLLTGKKFRTECGGTVAGYAANCREFFGRDISPSLADIRLFTPCSRWPPMLQLRAPAAEKLLKFLSRQPCLYYSA
jgi:hypothetical protein